MPTLRELHDTKAQTWERMKEIMAAGKTRDMTSEELQAYESAETELERITGQIDLQERHQRVSALFDTAAPSTDTSARDGGSAPADPAQRYARAYGAWLRSAGGIADLEPEQRAALRQGHVEARALGVATGAGGGFTVPAEFRERIVETMKAFGGMLQVAEILNTDTGAQIPWPTNDDTANKGAILAENTQITEQDVTFGQATIDAYMYTSKLVRISYQLLQDTAFNMEVWLPGKLGERLGRILNEHLTTGTGTAQPQGIVTGAPVGKTGAAGQVATFTYDDMIDLIESPDPAYTGAGNSRFMMNIQARKVLRRLKDADGRPLWEPSLQVGVPDQFLGYGIVINQDMPNPAASAKSVLFGDYQRAYLARMVTDVQTVRLNERYADFLQVGFFGFQRAGGVVQDTAAVRAYQHPAA